MAVPARALGRLHPIHAVALCLNDLGHTDDEIAAQLELPPEAIATLLQVAASKVTHALAEEAIRSAAEDPG